jgi:hypothetical protein
MDTMDGDLEDYLEKTVVSLNTIAGILFVVRNQLTCIDHSGGAYLDIKCANVLYRESEDGMLEIHLGDIDSIAEKPKNADDTFARSFAVPCNLGAYGCTPENCSAPVLVDYLTELLYMSMMVRYCIKQEDGDGEDFYENQLYTTKCKKSEQIQERTRQLATKPEYAQVYGYMRALAKQNQKSDTTICRHCLLVPETGDPTVVDCVRKNLLKGCAVMGLDRHNYVFYGYSDNRLVGIRDGSVAFKEMSRAVNLSPIPYNPWRPSNVRSLLDTSMSTS